MCGSSSSGCVGLSLFPPTLCMRCVALSLPMSMCECGMSLPLSPSVCGHVNAPPSLCVWACHCPSHPLCGFVTAPLSLCVWACQCPSHPLWGFVTAPPSSLCVGVSLPLSPSVCGHVTAPLSLCVGLSPPLLPPSVWVCHCPSFLPLCVSVSLPPSPLTLPPIQCPYRHSEKAKRSVSVCKNWERRQCSNKRCPLRHPGTSKMCCA